MNVTCNKARNKSVVMIFPTVLLFMLTANNCICGVVSINFIVTCHDCNTGINEIANAVVRISV